MFHARNHESQIERLKNRPFHCNICGKGFATESSLRTHTGKVSAGQEIKKMQNLVVMKYLAYYFYMQVYFFRLFFFNCHD